MADGSQRALRRRQLALFGGSDSAAVPQADRLPQVRRLVLAVRDGIHHPATLLEFLAVDQRHFSYYRQACELLRLITIHPDRTLSLTGRGLRLLATGEGSTAERALFRQAIEQGPLAHLAELFQGFEPTLDTFAEHILSSCNLAPSTALRRARTLLLWRRYLDGKLPRPATKLELPNLTPRLTKLIAHHNALAKQTSCFSPWLRLSPPFSNPVLSPWSMSNLLQRPTSSSISSIFWMLPTCFWVSAIICFAMCIG